MMTVVKSAARYVRLAFLVAIASCMRGGKDSTPTAPMPVLTTVSVTMGATTLQVGQSSQANAAGLDQNNAAIATGAVTWSSSAPTVATISASGSITAVGAGQTQIVAVTGGRTGQAALTVIPVPVASVSVTPSTSSLILGTTAQLTATPKDANGNALTGRTVTWASSNATIASVSAAGLVTAVAVGGPVTVTAAVEGINGTASVTVLPVPVMSVTVSPSSSSLVQGTTTQLTATPKDANGNALTGRTVTWASSNATIASVSAAGLVTAVAVGGPVTVTAAVEGINGTASVTVTPVPVASVSVSPATASLIAGATQQLTATMHDANNNVLTGRAVTWSTSDISKATVSSVGLVTAVAGGTATVSALSEGRTGSVQVTVSAAATLPLSFLDDVGLVSPNSSAQIRVVDAGGRILPTTAVTYTIKGYWNETADSRLSIDGTGTVRLAGVVSPPWYAFRVRATAQGQPVQGQVFVVAHPTDAARTILRTNEWRLFLPSNWASQMQTQIPDHAAVFDVGRLAQKDLMGWTYGESWNAFDPTFMPAVPFESIAEDPADGVCGYNGNPIGFRQSCFFMPAGGPPWWAAIFHELGHNSMSLVAKLMFSEITKGGGLYGEGDANILSRWSGHAIAASALVSTATKATVAQNYADNETTALNRLHQWESSTDAFNDCCGDWLWEGIHTTLEKEYGTDYLRRYVRAGREDSVVRDLVYPPPRRDAWYNYNTPTQRATFFAAALSAAVRQDLRQRFKNWRFPIDDALFTALYNRFMVTMDQPL